MIFIVDEISRLRMYFSRAKGTRGLKIKLCFNPSRSTPTRQSHRSCRLFGSSKWLELLAPAVNAATRSSPCSSTCPQTFQPSDKASDLAGLDFNIANALTLKPLKLQTVCLVHLLALLPQNRYLALGYLSAGLGCDMTLALLQKKVQWMNGGGGGRGHLWATVSFSRSQSLNLC